MRKSATCADNGLISPAALSGLVGAIYDCVLDPPLWPDALSAIRHELGCHNAVLAMQALPSNQVLLHVSEGIAPEWIERMVTYGPEVVDIWGGPAAYNAHPLLEPLVLSQVSAAHFTRNRYYLEWMRPQGLVDAIGIGLSRDAHSVGSLGLGRHESSGQIGARDLEVARLLIPHLHRAVVITRQLDARSLAATTFETVFDTITTPIIIVGGDLSVMHANQAAQVSLEQRAPLSVEKGRLAAASRAVMAALGTAIDQMCQDESAAGMQGLGVPALGTGDEACVLHVLPLTGGRLRQNLPTDAVAAIFIASRAAPAPAPAELIRTLFGLTAAEARVYEQVAAGATMAQAAARLGVGSSTIKTHVLRIYEKTGAHRHSDLIALAESLAAPARQGPLP